MSGGIRCTLALRAYTQGQLRYHEGGEPPHAAVALVVAQVNPSRVHMSARGIERR